MTKAEKQHYLDMRTVGYWSGFDGLEVKELQYGIEGYAIVVSGSFTGTKNVHRLRVYYDDRPYIKLFDRKWFFDECIRNGV